MTLILMQIDLASFTLSQVVIDCFRLINTQMLVLGQEPRQTTSNLGHLHKPSMQALVHGLNRHYYSIAIDYRKNALEQKMLLNLNKKNWTAGNQSYRFLGFASINAYLFSLCVCVCVCVRVYCLGLSLLDYTKHSQNNTDAMSELLALSKAYHKVKFTHRTTH